MNHVLYGLLWAGIVSGSSVAIFGAVAGRLPSGDEHPGLGAGVVLGLVFVGLVILFALVDAGALQ